MPPSALPAARGPARLWIFLMFALALVPALSAGTLPAQGAEPPLIPREVLFGNPDRISPQLSPDGTTLAYVAPDSGVLNVWIRTVGKTDDHPLTRDRGRGINSYFWAPAGDQILYIQDRNGDENWHVYAMKASGGEPMDLTPVAGVQARILAVSREHPDEILVGLNDRIPQLHDVWRVNLKTGERTLEIQNDITALQWSVDHELRVRLALSPTPEGGFSLKSRDGSAWKEILKWGPEDALTTAPIGWTADNKNVYMFTSVGGNASALKLLHLDTGQQETLAADPASDVDGIFVHPTEYRVQAVSFNKDRREWKILDPSVRKDFERLSKLHAGDFGVVDRDLADKVWLVGYTQDSGPVVYYTYDREKGTGTFLFSAWKRLEGLQLAEMKPVQYKARDGRTIHGYLSLPPGLKAKNLPAVVNVHGGPWYRDSWGYHPEAQWLANRGYACLQVNFRGSTGYGKDFLNAGDREWGGKMQDDISDGVRWLVSQGIADPKRIAIYGGSFGGYAALCGMTLTPDLYACGISMCGPSNLSTFITSIPPYWAPMKAIFDRRVGNPEKDAEMLKARSPLFHVDAIRAPLLIAQGANDPRVKKEESIQIRDALQKQGKQVEYLEFADEGHGFVRPENRLKFYAAAEAFLARNLGGRAEPDSAAAPAGVPGGR